MDALVLSAPSLHSPLLLRPPEQGFGTDRGPQLASSRLRSEVRRRAGAHGIPRAPADAEAPPLPSRWLQSHTRGLEGVAGLVPIPPRSSKQLSTRGCQDTWLGHTPGRTGRPLGVPTSSPLFSSRHPALRAQRPEAAWGQGPSHRPARAPRQQEQQNLSGIRAEEKEQQALCGQTYF